VWLRDKKKRAVRPTFFWEVRLLEGATYPAPGFIVKPRGPAAAAAETPPPAREQATTREDLG